MKRILLLFLVLLTVFFTAWGVKARTPINRPSSLAEEQEVPWYELRYSAPQADEEWYLDPEIPLNYIPVPGEDELYMVVDDSGKITGYRKRTLQADGSWLWQDVNPDIPENYEKVDGLENVYKVTNEDGSVSYYLYVRNEDDTYCFVSVDENGVPLDDGTSADSIEENYIHENGNVYAVYNDDNVRMGFRERVKQSDGSYIWKVCEAPAETSSGITEGWGSTAEKETGGGNKVLVGNGNSDRQDNGDGTYTVTETSTNTVTEGGYTITYQTTVKSTYDRNGNLLSTKKDGPYEISRVAAGGSTSAPNKNKIASTLDGELSRVSASVTFDAAKANEVLSKLNAERRSQGLPALSMDTGCEAYKLACIRAADMAIYDHASSSSPMYGSLNELVSRYGCHTSHASENIWKASTKSASDIHTRFQANEDSRKVRMSSGYSEVGIAIVERNNQTYIAEIYLK
uniref:CAP domain-containing protein n=1 Tax=Lachnoclostridium phocaeense TaxID=1871021 RepID=UPI0026DAF483|nr:CAP domain-containing protein [Lachnoclostridium phocaeense]